MKIAYLRSTSIFDDSRATKEITAFLDAGHQVVVLGWNRVGSITEEKCKEVFHSYSNSVAFSFYCESTGESTISKMISRLKWNHWIENALMKDKVIDIIHACDFDTAHSAMKAAKNKRIPFVYDIYDYYVDAHRIPRFIRFLVEKRDINIINNSDATIICTEERMEQIRKATPKRVVVIHNSPDISEVQANSIEYDYVYCGTLGNKRLIKEIVNNYSKHCDLKFVFAGSGANSSLLQHYDEQYPNFQYLGSISYKTVLEIEAKSKIISAIYDPSYRNHKLCAPNKFYEAMGLGKPVIVCRGTGIDKVVEKYGIGMVIDYNSEDFYKAVEYLTTHQKEAEEMGTRAKKLYSEKYEWKKMRALLLQLYSDIC